MLQTEPPSFDALSDHHRAPLLQWTHGLINRIVAAVDIAALTLSSLVGWSMSGHAANLLPFAQALLLAVAGALCAALALHRNGGYRVERYHDINQTLRDLALLIGLAILCNAVALVLWLPIKDLSRWLAQCLVAQVGLMMLARLLSGCGVSLIEFLGLLRRRVAIVGPQASAEAMALRFGDPALSRHYSLIGVYDDGSLDSSSAVRDAASQTLADLAHYAESHPVDLIVLCTRQANSDGVQSVIDRVQWIAADVVIPIERGQQVPSGRSITLAGGERVTLVMHRPFKGSLGLLKLAEDYVVAGAALLLIAPALLVVAAAIRLDSPGPILFHQQRVGFNNKIFMIYKFRTMTVDPNDDGRIGTNVPDHPRITRVGAILRRLSIDELPQLLNVLAGDMSMVGPRPYVRNMLLGDISIDDSIRQFAARHRIKPGLTGWAQVHGLRGNALRSVEGAQRSVELDIEYISNWSLWLDVRIMIQTVGVLAGQNVF